MMKNNFWHFIKFLVGGGGQKVAPPPSTLSGAKGRTNEINRREFSPGINLVNPQTLVT